MAADIASPSPPRRLWRRFALAFGLLLAVALLVAGGFALDEARTSRRQAAWFAERAGAMAFEPGPGASPSIRFPADAPYDARLGYSRLPEFTQRLQGAGFEIAEQARLSPAMAAWIDQGWFAPYREKSQAGLTLLDCRGDTLARTRSPQRVYEGFDAVPRLLVDALLFIENRELLDPQTPMRNPAVEWDRLGKAALDHARRALDPGHPAGGGSTLATQVEKYRHSPEGRTDSAREKLRQMVSGSMRAYLDGERTLARRQEIVVDYVNTVPLAARAGFGEVNGIGDGLWAWYGRDFDEVNALLADAPADAEDAAPDRALAGASPRAPRGAADPAARALAFKQALSLMVAQRRPSHYLLAGTGDLRSLTDSHLRVLADAGVIPAALRDAALPLPLAPRGAFDGTPPGHFVDRKAVSAVRNRLQSLLGMARTYDLERLDLTAHSTVDGAAQQAVTSLLRGLADPRAARDAGLYGPRLLRAEDDPSRIVFSVTLYERGAGGNLLRLQADNLDQPLDINEGARLDLGSTAKLRTLVTYLEFVAELHRQWGALDAEALASLEVHRRDPIGAWAREHLLRAPDRSLSAMLAASLERTYSASPAESFFTGGGVHRFDNFDREDDRRTVTVREAMTRSVNLPFVRLMRDLVLHVLARGEGASGALLEDVGDERRADYLARFADQEGRQFVARFFRKHAGRTADQIEALLVQHRRPTPARLAATLYGLEPEADLARLADFVARHRPDADLSAPALQALRERYGPTRWSLADRGYLAGVHPLELWVAAHLRAHPGASLGDTIAASAQERQDVYRWLFRTRHKGAQDARIRRLLEEDAFAEIHRAWQRLGYPYARLTPSYASALGASGDRPAALAELMGIIVNDGVRRPVTHLDALHFAAGTPYETRLVALPVDGERVMAPEVATALRGALLGVVESGTARRLHGTLKGPDGKPLAVGGKTGTGDHRYETYGRGGVLLSSRVINRTGTLVFFIGDRWFGTLMAYVGEPHAAAYEFTSALPSQLLKALAPALAPLVGGTGCDGGGPPGDALAADQAPR